MHAGMDRVQVAGFETQKGQCNTEVDCGLRICARSCNMLGHAPGEPSLLHDTRLECSCNVASHVLRLGGPTSIKLVSTFYMRSTATADSVVLRTGTTCYLVFECFYDNMQTPLFEFQAVLLSKPTISCTQYILQGTSVRQTLNLTDT